VVFHAARSPQPRCGRACTRQHATTVHPGNRQRRQVTHDRYFLDNVTGWTLELDEGRVKPFHGGPTPATSAPGLGPPLPHLHRDWACPHHICAGTGLSGVGKGYDAQRRMPLTWIPFHSIPAGYSNGVVVRTYTRRVRCWRLAGNYTGWLKQKASEMELRDNKEKKLQARAQSQCRCGRG
jgi:hypothetical protein